MYNLTKNNYHKNPKPSNIPTPLQVSQFIFELLRDKIPKGLIFDPCCGWKNLLKPWKEDKWETFSIDIDKIYQPNLIADFLNPLPGGLVPKKEEIGLILCNPPFNGYSHKLGSEVWLDKIIELFGKEVPIVLFAPIGFRLNLTCQSKRWLKFNQGEYPPISSIIALPKDCFEGVVFHSEILIFNVEGLKGHYFYHDQN